MTEYVYFMLQICFSILLGFVWNMLLIIVKETISNIELKLKSHKEKSNK